MRSAGWAGASWRSLLLTVLCATPLVLAAEGPDISVTSLDNRPVNLGYFEDSDVVMFRDDAERALYRSEDAGKSWNKLSDIPDVVIFVSHPFEQKTAFALSEGTTHYKTEDRGKTWTKFDSGTRPSRFQREILSFHAGDPKRIIFNGMDCDIFCDEESAYTTDGFKSVKLLRAFTAGCRWAKSTPEFTTGDKDLDESRTLCMVTDPFSFFKEDQTLHISDSYFAVVDKSIQEFQPDMDTDKGASGVVNVAVVKGFLVVATSGFNSDEMALYVTDDTKKWHRAMFPSDDSHDHSHTITQEAYTVLESTNYSIQIDVMTSHPSRPMGVMFTSNSNGTYFTENIPYTNRNPNGMVDFEKISGIQGVFLINIVENGPKVDKDGESKNVVSRITFDDGRTFEPIKAGDDAIHLHSFTELDNIGRVFSSYAPGLVLGNGNTGKSLDKFAESNLFVSDDAGVSWKKALDGPHKYEFGDSGSVLVAVKDASDVKEIQYSLNHGDDWESVKLPKDLEIEPVWLTTTQDSTSLKFLLLGKKSSTFHMVAIDFNSLKLPTCDKGDMEDWHARVDDDGKPTCIMGHQQTYRRRKKDAKCFINKEFEDPVAKTEDCECTDADFECDYNFQRDPDDKTVCKKIGPVIVPEGECTGKSKIFKGSSGWRLIPGNTCKRTKGEQKDKEVDRDCEEGAAEPSPPASGDISHKKFEFDTKLQDFQKIYLERGDKHSGSAETVIVRPAIDPGDGRLEIDDKIWRTTDHGKTFERILEDEKIKAIITHSYYGDIVYFTTDSEKVIYSIDGGNSFHSFKAPSSVGKVAPLRFHPERKDWLIWVGEKCDKIGKEDDCVLEASISTDRGDNWKTMLRYVQKCEFTGSTAYKAPDRDIKQIICLAREEERTDAAFTIMSSNDFFTEDKTEFKGEVQDFATMSEFIVVAGQKAESGDLHAIASLDGKHFEAANFPLNFNDDHESVYTLLDSSTHAVNLFVREHGEADREYGSIIKSNSNGTSYVLSAANVNCNHETYVDFEKVSGLEGVVLINVVANPGKKEKTKKLQTKISHNDGSEWGYLTPPAKDVEGKSYKCSGTKGDANCALHVHHYTERDDKRNTFAASTAVGLIFGIGNVGSSLGDIEKADTFMSSDGGVTWKNVKKGHWTWQYGDQGSIIVLVERATTKNKVKTKTVSYSTDEGKTWKDYEFSSDEVSVLDITTVRSGKSRNFLLWCRTDKNKIFSVNIDFTGLTDKACKMDEDDSGKSDYFLWSPKHPFQDDDCLFGHVARYLRKKTDRECFNDKNLMRLYDYSDCACSRRDYECAYNYELDNHGQCSLVKGMEPLSPKEECRRNNATSWFEPTGYRRVPLSTCKGGNELDKTSTEHPCEGFEDDFEKKHGISGVAVFFAVVIPFALAGCIGWYVFKNWDGKFGQIRLGDSMSTFDSEQPWIKYPVIVISAVAAVAASIPFLLTSLWRTATGAYQRVGAGGSGGRDWFSSGQRRFTTRDSFARRRGDYSGVDDDEGELLGDDSDEEV
ncbi:vacuolar protein sorting/targeting protein 10 [Sarocladium strictum]